MGLFVCSEVGHVWGGHIHVRIGVLPRDGGGERPRGAGDGAGRGELEHARVVPCVGGRVGGIGAPVDEREGAADVRDEEVLGRRRVCADGAERVRERDHVCGRLRTRARGGAGRAAVAVVGRRRG